MGVPTEEERQAALAEAARLRESGQDDYYLGKTLLNLNYRLALMEEVLAAARRYLHSGESSRAHAQLERAIEKAETAARRGGETPSATGLL